MMLYDLTLKYFLILFICYLPVYLALLIFLRTRIEGYTVRTHMVSYLATACQPWRSVFNGSMILYGALSYVLPASIIKLVGVDSLGFLGAASMLATGTSTVLVGIFPMDNQLKAHNAVAFLAFISLLLTGIVFNGLFQRDLPVSHVMQLVNFIVISMTLLFAISLLLRHRISSLVEWALVICTIAWNFLFSISILNGMI